MSKYRGVIFDVDGVLIDSEPLHYKALTYVSRDLGWHIDDEANQNMLGLSLSDVFHKLQMYKKISISYSEWAEKTHKYYLNNLQPNMIRPGVRQVINLLVNANIPFAFVSSAEKIIVEANLRKIRLINDVAFYISKEDVKQTKPFPDPYLLAVDKLGLNSSECIAVEDTSIGLCSAKRAGLTTVAFPHAMTVPYPKDAADYVVSKIESFPWSNLFSCG